MIVQVNRGSSIDGNDTAVQGVEATVRNALGHYADRITRIEVHLSDDNSDKKSGADDKRCMLEARLARRKPVAVTHNAPTVAQAVDGAATKMLHLLENSLGRLKSRAASQSAT